MKKKTTKKKSKKVGSRKKDPIYVGIFEPASLYRNILETNKQFIITLKESEKLKDIRKRKEEAIAKFHTQVTSIRTKIHRLQKLLPHHQIQYSLADIPDEEPPAIKIKPRNEMDKFDSELQDIDKKLSKL